MEPIVVGPDAAVPVVRVDRVALRAARAAFARGETEGGLLFGRGARTRWTPDAIRAAQVGGAWTMTLDAFDRGSSTLPPPAKHALPLKQPSPDAHSARDSRPCRAYVVRRAPSSTSGGFPRIQPGSETDDLVADTCQRWLRVAARLRPGSCAVPTLCMSLGPPLGTSEPVSLRLEMAVPNLTLTFTRVPTVPVLSTELSRHLEDISLAENPDRANDDADPDFAFGFLTLNETRKAVLLLESDPAAYRVPVVGVWVRGGLLTDGSTADMDANAFAAYALADPGVYAACVRYVCSPFLRERVSPIEAPTTFLVCVYPTGGRHRVFEDAGGPLFLECAAAAGPTRSPLVRFESDVVRDVDVGLAATATVVELGFRTVSDAAARHTFAESVRRLDVARDVAWGVLGMGGDVAAPTTTTRTSTRAPLPPSSTVDDNDDMPVPFPHPPSADAFARSVQLPTSSSSSSSLSRFVDEEAKADDVVRTTFADLPTSGHDATRDFAQVVAAQQLQLAQLREQVRRLEAVLASASVSAPVAVGASPVAPAAPEPRPPPRPVPVPVPVPTHDINADDDGNGNEDEDDADVAEIEQRYLSQLDSSVAEHGNGNDDAASSAEV